MDKTVLQSPKPKTKHLKQTEPQNAKRTIVPYIGFVLCIPFLKLQKHFMKPSGGDIDHFSSFLYDIENHLFLVGHPLAGIVTMLILFGIFFIVSWGVIRSWWR